MVLGDGIDAFSDCVVSILFDRSHNNALGDRIDALGFDVHYELVRKGRA
jgi:hypothetical protein